MSHNYLRNHLKSEFAQIPNALIEDRELSATARALFCYLAVKPDDWKFKMKDIADALLISIPTLRKVIAELSMTGWIDDGGQNRGKKGEFGAKIFSIYPTKGREIWGCEECKVKKIVMVYANYNILLYFLDNYSIKYDTKRSCHIGESFLKMKNENIKYLFSLAKTAAIAYALPLIIAFMLFWWMMR